MLVKDLMTSDVFAVRPETPLKEVAFLLAKHGFGGAPVVDADGHVVGVVSESDFLIKQRGRADVGRSPLSWLLGNQTHDLARVEATTAGEAMTAPPFTIEVEATVREAATMMARRHVNRLPVVEGGRLVGLITRGDVLRLYTRPDEEIAAATREALRAVDGIRVTEVRNGVVRLAGTVASPALADATVRIVEAMDGVVGVDRGDLTAPEHPEHVQPAGSMRW